MELVRLFSLRIFYQLTVKKIPTFARRARSGVCLYHEGGVIYHLLTETGIVSTKQREPEKLKFPVMPEFGQPVYGDVEHDSTLVEIPIVQHSDRNSDPDSGWEDGDQASGADLEALAYAQTKPGKFWKSNHVDSDGEVETYTETDQKERVSRLGYNLRPQNRVDYSFMVQ